MSEVFLKRFFFFIFIFLLSSCSSSLKPLFPKVTDLNEVSKEEARSVLSSLSSSSCDVKSLRMFSDVTLKKKGFKEKFNMLVVFSRPSDFRLDFLAPGINQPILLLSVFNSVLKAFDANKKVLYLADVSRESFFKLAKIPLDVDDFMNWVIGRPLKFNGDKDFSLYIANKETNPFYLYKYKNEDIVITLGIEKYVDKSGSFYYLIKNLELGDINGDVFFSTSYFYNMSNLDYKLPSSFVFQLEKEKIKGKVIFLESKVNNKVSKKVFQIRFPKNVNIKKLY